MKNKTTLRNRIRLPLRKNTTQTQESARVKEHKQTDKKKLSADRTKENAASDRKWLRVAFNEIALLKFPMQNRILSTSSIADSAWTYSKNQAAPLPPWPHVANHRKIPKFALSNGELFWWSSQEFSRTKTDRTESPSVLPPALPSLLSLQSTAPCGPSQSKTTTTATRFSGEVMANFLARKLVCASENLMAEPDGGG